MYKDSLGRFLTVALFYETRRDNIEPVFTTKDYDHEVKGVVYKSMKKLYFQYSDPTEYSFAMGVLGSWAHWQRLVNNKMFGPMIQLWREELEIKLRSEAIMAVRDIANNEEDKGQLSAAKWIADKGWEPKRGRPTKLEVEKEKKIAAGISSELDDDYERIVGGNTH